MKSPPPKVFISYSHDSQGHCDRVLALADSLRSHGIESILDQYEEFGPDEGWARWTTKHIRAADFVIIVCTEIYYRRVMGDEPTATGHGAKWEGNLIFQSIFDEGAENRRFIPVLFNDGKTDNIPNPLRQSDSYHIDDPVDYSRLYRRLTSQPRHAPPKLGDVCTLPPRERQGNSNNETSYADQNSFPPAFAGRKQPPRLTADQTPLHDEAIKTDRDLWKGVRKRITAIEPNPMPFQDTLRETWDRLEKTFALSHDIQALLENRALLADRLFSEVFAYVAQQSNTKVNQLCIVARGGYGLGVLSLGSDIDFTTFHEPAHRAIADHFHTALQHELEKTWQVTPAIQMAPIMSTVHDCSRDWNKAIVGPADLASLASFAVSRHLAGNRKIHDQLRLNWEDFVRGLNMKQMRMLTTKLLTRINAVEHIHAQRRLDIKRDAGGILDLRLCSFIERIAAVRGLELPTMSSTFAEARRYLLCLREAAFRCLGTHLLTTDIVQEVALFMQKCGYESASPKMLHCQIDQHRQVIRGNLTLLISLLQKVVRKKHSKIP